METIIDTLLSTLIGFVIGFTGCKMFWVEDLQEEIKKLKDEK